MKREFKWEFDFISEGQHPQGGPTFWNPPSHLIVCGSKLNLSKLEITRGRPQKVILKLQTWKESSSGNSTLLVKVNTHRGNPLTRSTTWTNTVRNRFRRGLQIAEVKWCKEHIPVIPYKGNDLTDEGLLQLDDMELW